MNGYHHMNQFVTNKTFHFSMSPADSELSLETSSEYHEPARARSASS